MNNNNAWKIDAILRVLELLVAEHGFVMTKEIICDVWSLLMKSADDGISLASNEVSMRSIVSFLHDVADRMREEDSDCNSTAGMTDTQNKERMLYAFWAISAQHRRDCWQSYRDAIVVRGNGKKNDQSNLDRSNFVHVQLPVVVNQKIVKDDN